MNVFLRDSVLNAEKKEKRNRVIRSTYLSMGEMNREKCHWLKARTSLCHPLLPSLDDQNVPSQSLNNELLVAGKTFNSILVKNRSRVFLLKHWDLLTVQMALNFSFFNLFLKLLLSPRIFWLFFMVEIKKDKKNV